MKRLVMTLVLIPALLLAAPRPTDVDSTTRSQTIESLSKHLVENYVDEAIGKRAASTIQANLKAGKYDSIGDGAVFAKTLTDDLNAVCHDAHLRVRFSEEKLPERKDARQPSPEEVARQREYSRLANAGFEEVKRLSGNIGYLHIWGFFDPKDVARPCQAAFDFLKNTDALILDLRDNGGGSPEGVQLVCSYFFDKPTHLNSLYFREGNETIDFWTKKVKGAKFLGKEVYVLVSKRTGSGAEECTYNLQTQKRATIIGESTWGGANPGGVVRLNDHFGAFIPVGKAINPITKTNWEGTGVTPDVRTEPAQALKVAQGMAVKKLLSTAKTDADRERLQEVLREIEETSKP